MALYPTLPPGALGGGYGIAQSPQHDLAMQELLSKGMFGPGMTPRFDPSGTMNAAPSAPTAAYDTVDAGAEPLKKPPGLLGRIKQQPGGAKALLAFGSSMLQSQNFFDGLGKATMAYQGTLDAEADKLKPQLTKDAQFTTQINPETGEVEFKRTPVADFEEHLQNLKLKAADLLGRYRTDVNSDTKRYTTDREYDYKDKELGFRDNWNRDDNNSAERIAQISADAAERRARIAAATGSNKPPPAGVLKLYEENEAGANAAAGTLDLGSKVMSDFDNGTLDLGLLNNLRAKGASMGIGSANASTRAYAQLEQFAQSLTNAVLLDARGVQTDGDAVRARIMNLVSKGDTEGARRELSNAMSMVERGRSYRAARAEDISNQYGINTTTTRQVTSGNGGGGWGKAKVVR